MLSLIQHNYTGQAQNYHPTDVRVPDDTVVGSEAFHPDRAAERAGDLAELARECGDSREKVSVWGRDERGSCEEEHQGW